MSRSTVCASCAAATKLTTLVCNFGVPAFNVRDLVLGKLQCPFCCLEGFNFFEAAGTKIARTAHATLMQPYPRLVHLPHAELNFTLPENRPVLFQPQSDLTELAVEHLQAGPGLVLKHRDRGCETPQGIGGIDVC